MEHRNLLAASIFDVTTSFSSGGSSPYNLAAADLDQDGDADLAIANIGGSAGILLNNGQGSFTTKSFSTGGYGAYNVAIADFNNDGAPDLAMTTFSRLVVLYNSNDGNANFSGMRTFDSLSSYNIAAGDLNGDGNADLALGGGSSGIRILLGDGAGGFSQPVALQNNFYHHDVAIADVNHDGKPDIVGATMSSNGAAVHLNLGNGTFSPASHYVAGGSGSRHVAVGDLNGDGHFDIVTANKDSHTVSILAGNGSGQFSLAATMSSGGMNPYSVGVADFDGDSRPDIVVTNTDNKVGVLLANGAGSFQSVQVFDAGGGASSAWTHDLVVADLNNDSLPDVATVHTYSHRVGVLLNTSNAAPVAVADSYTVSEDGALTVSAGSSAGSIAPTAMLGAGSAVQQVDRLATFDTVQTGLSLDGYVEDGLRISVPDVAFVYSSDPGFSGGHHYPSGGANYATSIRAADGSEMYGVEFNASNGWGGGNNLRWWMIDDGVTIGSGTLVSARGAVSAISYSGGFDELLVGAYFTFADAQSATPSSFQALSIDNVKAQLTQAGVLANDTDADGDPLQASLISGPANGALTLNPDGSFGYVPNANYSGNDSFTYRAFDGNAFSNEATVTITVTEVNDPPIATPDTASVDEDGSVVINVLGNDSSGPANESGQLLTVVAASADHGTVDINGDGTLTYTPDPDYNGSDTISYTIQDDGTTDGSPDPRSASSSVAVTVTEVNDPPFAIPDTASVDEDGSVVINVLGNDSSGPANESGQLLTVVAASADHGTVDINGDGTLTYTPDPDYNGSDTISYTIQDDGTTDGSPDPLSASSSVAVTVNPVNDAPSFTAGADQTVDEDAGAQSVAWATDISAGPLNESSQNVNFDVTNDNSGLFSVQPSIAPDGTLSYTPSPNANGSATVTVALVDDGGTASGGADTSAPQTFVITVNAVVDALIDVKPGNGDEVDPINLGSKGVTPIAILATQLSAGEPDDFDPAAIDLALVSFKINGESISAKKMTLEDVDDDGDLDLLLHFATEDLAEILTANDSELTLSAEFGGAALGADLGGADAIRVVPKKGKP